MEQSITLADTLETYRGNMYPGMYALLSQQVGVSRDSLERLGVGFYPAKHSWVFPERDETGEVTGLVLRTMAGKKFTVEGSKRSLTYILNPDYEVGDRRYYPGKHNWVRAYETDYNCPLCDTNNWCLLSADDPSDPPAVICGRTPQGATKDLGNSNYLHILKQTAKGGYGGALLPSDDPIIVVEGQTDMLTATDLGFVSVGRPNNLAGQGLLKALLYGRTVIIVGENDPPDKHGRIPGVEGMEATFETLYNAKCDVTRILPPEGSKDFRAWVTRFGLTHDQFLEQVELRGEKRRNVTILTDDMGITVAKAWMEQEHWKDDMPTIRDYKGRWIRFNDNRYEIVDKEVLRGEVYRYLDGRYYFKEVKGVDEPTRFNLSQRKVSDVMDALLSFGPITEDPPQWLCDELNLPDPVNLIQFKNGILDVNEYLQGRVRLLDPTPKLFSFTALPHTFVPEAHSTYWTNYLDEVFNGDEQRIRLLRQWFGYNLVPDTSYEKLMFFVGTPRSGKGTIITAMNAMLGDEQVCSTSLKALAGRFGLAPMMGTLACLLGDAKCPRGDNSQQALEKILQITGGDPVGVDRKGVSELPQVHLQCRFTIAMNLLPNLPDHATALEPRLNILQFPNSYVGREDRSIKQNMKKVAGDIIPWALEGLRDLRESKLFCLPDSSIPVISDFKDMSSPVYGFVKDYCDKWNKGEGSVEVELLYDAWKHWTAGQNIRSGVRPQFLQRLRALCPNVTEDTIDNGTREVQIYRGITLKPWVEKEMRI